MGKKALKMIRRVFRDIKKYFNFIIYSAKASLKSEVANSHLGFVWWILEPLLFMLIYLFVGIVVFKKGEKFFAIFVFIGLSMWNFFNKGISGSVKTVQRYSAIVGKIYIPKYILLLSDLCRLMIKMFISFIIVFIMMAFYRVPIDLNIVYFFPIIMALFMITFGISSIVLHFGVYVEDLKNVIDVGFKMVFYLTGIFYSIKKRVPKNFSKYLLKFNPIACLIDACRQSLLYSSTPVRKLILVWFLVGIVLSLIGIYLIYKNENSYAKVM